MQCGRCSSKWLAQSGRRRVNETHDFFSLLSPTTESQNYRDKESQISCIRKLEIKETRNQDFLRAQSYWNRDLRYSLRLPKVFRNYVQQH